MKKPNQGYQEEKYCLLFHLFKCVVSKQYDLDKKNRLKCYKTKS